MGLDEPGPRLKIVKLNINKIVDNIECDFNNIHEAAVAAYDRDKKWTETLSDEDLAFIKRFVLASGSLKAAAQAYGVSYPTVRLRLDRLIEKIKILDSEEIASDFERLARAKHADGAIDITTLKELIAAHRRELGDRE
jgi:hypothetical protein